MVLNPQMEAKSAYVRKLFKVIPDMTVAKRIELDRGQKFRIIYILLLFTSTFLVAPLLVVLVGEEQCISFAGFVSLESPVLQPSPGIRL